MQWNTMLFPRFSLVVRNSILFPCTIHLKNEAEVARNRSLGTLTGTLDSYQCISSSIIRSKVCLVEDDIRSL